MRHIERHHHSENEVRSILELPLNSKARREAVILLRKDTNFNLHLLGTTRPYRKPNRDLKDTDEYYPCYFCKGLFRKLYLKRHTKVCINKPPNSAKTKTRTHHLSNSQTMVACAMDATDTVSKMNVKEQVFDKMKGDDISFVAKRDLLIVHFGETYLKKHRKERMGYACSNRMRELARLLISYRQQVNNAKISLKDMLCPENMENVLSAVRSTVGYEPIKKTFRAPSLAMHMGTSLKMACDELTHLILKQARGFQCTTSQKSTWLKAIKQFKYLVEFRWNSEVASLANKDLQEKRWNKLLLLPLTNDIKIFRDCCFKMAAECQESFLKKTDDILTYKTLVNCTLSLLILFNRRRIGDVQFLQIESYKKDQRTNSSDFAQVLTETENILTTKYKRVLNGGKGSRAVVILIPKPIEDYIELLLDHRQKYIPTENTYVFAMPGSTIPWGKGDVAIRTLTSKMSLEYPQAISSNKLRKHIATVMQILNLSKDESKQFAQFMGHTEKTHQEFYE